MYDDKASCPLKSVFTEGNTACCLRRVATFCQCCRLNNIILHFLEVL